MAKINSMIVYGPAGVGKTTLVARVMSDALWVVTRESNLGGYHTWLEQNSEEAAALNLNPIRAIYEVNRMTATPEGDLVAADVRGTIDAIVREYVGKAVRGETKVRGIVFDELSVLAKWVFDAMKEGERDGFKPISYIKQWVGELCEIASVTRLPMAFICHTKEPAFHEEGNKKGQIKYRGGPAMPVGTMIAEVCALPDAVFKMDVEQAGMDKTKLVIRTAAHPHWERKCRVWGTPPIMEPDLRPVLTSAGWTHLQAPEEKKND